MPRAMFKFGPNLMHAAYYNYSKQSDDTLHFDVLGPQCTTCSISYVAAKAMEFMVEHTVKKLTVDGLEIERI